MKAQLTGWKYYPDDWRNEADAGGRELLYVSRLEGAIDMADYLSDPGSEDDDQHDYALTVDYHWDHFDELTVILL